MTEPSTRPSLRADRIAHLQRGMRPAGIDVIVIGEPRNLRYLLGHPLDGQERLTVLLISSTAAAMVLPQFDHDEFVEHTGLGEAFGWADDHGPRRAVEAALASIAAPDRPVTAFDDGSPFRFVEQVREAAACGSLRSVSPLLAPLRMVKDASEIEAMARIGEIVSAAIDHAVDHAQVGMSERTLRRAIEHRLIDAGADTLDFVLVQTGANAASPHHAAGEDRVRDGEAVLIDIAVGLGGYHADITQQVWFGTPDPDYLEAYDVVRRSQQAGVRAARVGATAEDVAAACHEVMAASSFSAHVLPRIGHGIGIEVHEGPSMVQGDATPLRPGMTFTVEPGLYVPDRFGVRIEDTIVVTEGAARSLTRGDRPLAMK